MSSSNMSPFHRERDVPGASPATDAPGAPPTPGSPTSPGSPGGAEGTAPATTKPRRTGLGLPIIALIGLALLTAPRVILHDLQLIDEGTFVNMLLVFVPAAIWVAVVVARRVPNPFVTLLVIGAISGVVLLIVHQILWGVAFADNAPALGGNLSGLDPAGQNLIIRAFAGASSLVTGLVIGAVAGLIGWGVSSLVWRGRR